MKISIQDWLLSANPRLSANSEYASIESMAIACHITRKSREWLMAHPETSIPGLQLNKMEALLERLLNGEPLAYLTGKRSFYGLDFEVNEHVLIPRPETELLVELAVKWLNDHPGRRNVVDIGTGSGAIACAVAVKVPDVQILATDLSAAALKVARENAITHQVANRMQFRKNDLLSGIDDKFDLLLSNPPYIPTGELDQLAVARYEPGLALDGGENGMQLIKKLLAQSAKNVLPGACIFLEIQYNQANNVIQLGQQFHTGSTCTTFHDLAGLPRVIKIQL